MDDLTGGKTGVRIILVLIRDVVSGFCFLFCFSCNSESSQIGTDFFRDGSLDISAIDSVTIKLSTVKFDSLVTSQGPRILLGTHVDEKLGRITASTYFQPALTETVALDGSNISFEYLSVFLKYDGYSYYDTTIAQKLYVYQFRQEMELPGDGQLYNTTHFALQEAPIGAITFTPKPHSNDSIEIILDKSFGEDFFDRAKQGGNEFTVNDKFREYLKGFAITVDTTVSAGILGFTAQPELRLNYLDRGQVPAKKKYIAYNAPAGYSSTHIKTNRAGTKLQSLLDSRARLDATLTDQEAYFQAGAGLATRIDLPYLRNLKQLPNFYMTKAVLQLQPVQKSYNKFTRLPVTLKLHLINYRNGSLGEYSANALLIEDLSTGRDTYYEIDATAYVKFQMELEELNENALLLLLPDEDFRLRAERIYFANPSFHYNTRLLIYYATILN